MKRVIVCTLAVILIFGFVACNGNEAGMVSGDLGDVTLDSLMFTLDGVVYTLPVLFSELEANGWSVYEPVSPLAYCFASDILLPNDFASWLLILGDEELVVTFTNLSSEILSVSESYITTVLAHPTFSSAQIVFPGNITLGSTYDHMIAAYGEPNAQHSSEEPASLLIFYSADNFTLQIIISLESDLITTMSLHYWGS